MKVLKNLLLSLLFVALLPVSSKALQTPEVKVLEYAGIINPIAAEYLAGNIAKINEENLASLIVIMLDTPGGLDTSMRIIVKEIMASSIPVVIYVAPSGSRAASAGTFIAMAAHISAMAPGTSQGAASPVAGGGGEMTRTMEKKVKNDAAAYIRSLAKTRGRNEEWAEEAVRKAVSVDEQEALKMNIIDFVAENLEDLIVKLEGWSVETTGGKRVIKLKGATVTVIGMTERQKFLSIITNPTVAYMLLMLGFYGIMFELSNPGALLPGIVGGICVILGFYALQSLPVNYAGILLLLLAVILFVAELIVPTFGALTLGGVISMVLGGVMLIDSPAEYMRVKLSVIIPVAATLGLFFFFVVGWLYLFKPKKVSIGAEGLIGDTGVAQTLIDPFGTAEIGGELWDVRTQGEELQKGEGLKVLKKEGRILLVERNKSDEPGGEIGSN